MYSNIHIENNSSLNKKDMEAVTNRAITYVENNKTILSSFDGTISGKRFTVLMIVSGDILNISIEDYFGKK